MTEKNGGSQEPFLDVDAQLNSLSCYLAMLALVKNRLDISTAHPEEEPSTDQQEA